MISPVFPVKMRTGKLCCLSTLVLILILPTGVLSKDKEDSTRSNEDVLFQNIIPNYIQIIISSEEFNESAANELYKGLTSNCKIHLEEWINQLKNRQLMADTWALQMIDAWAKFPSGIFSGHTTVLGDFDECLRIRAHVNTSGKSTSFRGRFCNSLLTTNLTHLENVPSIFQVGTCYPSSCSNVDVQTFHKNAVGLVELPIKSVDVNACFTDDAPKLTTGDIVMIAVVGVLTFLCVLGTLMDVIYKQTEKSKLFPKPGFIFEVVTAFSVYTNTLKWASTKVTKDDIPCIHGLRFFTTTWVILIHTWFMVYGRFQPNWNAIDISKMHEGRWTIVPLLNGTLSVDTFFVIGGLLVSYNLLKLLNKTQKRPNILMMYLHRYIRMTPTYALIIGITATWFAYLRSGPNWTGMDMWATFCKNNWWHNILYINNLLSYSNVNGDGMCHGDSWYLAADMQLFILAPFLIYPLFKWRRLGLLILTLVTAASVIVPAMITYKYDLIPTMLPYAEPLDLLDYTVYLYMKPWTRGSSYMVGIWAGFILYQYRTNPRFGKLPKCFVLSGWLVASGLGLAAVYAMTPYYDTGSKIPAITSAIFAGLHRFLFGIVIAWIILACSLGYGGWISDFLAWKAFIPLGRLTFCVYLISYQLQLLFHLSIRHAASYDIYTSTNMFFSHVVMSFLIGFIFFVTVETPFLTLDKLFFRGESKARNPDNSNGGLRINDENGITNQAFEK